MLGRNVILEGFNNLYGCRLGSHSRIGTFVEIQKGASIGQNCTIGSHSFVCEGVTLEDDCKVGHGVMFVNTRVPGAVNSNGSMRKDGDWVCERTWVRKGARIGSGAIILCGLEIGEGAWIAPGAIVTRNVAPKEVTFGVLWKGE